MLDNFFTYVIGLYLTVYLLLFFFPRLLHRRRTFRVSHSLINHASMKILSHRGGKEFFNENSRSAFHDSKTRGLYGVELDVFSTKDNKLVVLHDLSLSRATGQEIDVHTLNYEQIVHYKEQFPNQLDDSERPPLFEEVLRMLQPTCLMVNVDIKSDRDEDVIHVCEVIQKYGFEDRVVLGCIMNENCKSIVKEMGLNIPTFFNRRECILFFLGFFSGLLPFIPFRNDVVEVPFNFSDMQDDKMSTSLWGKTAFAVLNYLLPLLRFFNRHMNRRGIPVIYWTLNCEKDWDTAIMTAANGIITDHPHRLSRFLSERNLFRRVEELHGI
jgi:glycerophosphoryl diester phosphodiesterase